MIQALLAIVLLVAIGMKTYGDANVVRRWWPWMWAVVTLLWAPLLVDWLGFGPQGIQAKTMAAELQSLATGLPWLMNVVSALQSISTKGMGLKTAGVIFTAGGGFGRVVVVPGFEQLRGMGFIAALERNLQIQQNNNASQPVEQRQDLAQDLQQPDPQHYHAE